MELQSWVFIKTTPCPFLPSWAEISPDFSLTPISISIKGRDSRLLLTRQVLPGLRAGGLHVPIHRPQLFALAKWSACLCVTAHRQGEGNIASLCKADRSEPVENPELCRRVEVIEGRGRVGSFSSLCKGRPGGICGFAPRLPIEEIDVEFEILKTILVCNK